MRFVAFAVAQQKRTSFDHMFCLIRLPFLILSLAPIIPCGAEETGQRDTSASERNAIRRALRREVAGA